MGEKDDQSQPTVESDQVEAEPVEEIVGGEIVDDAPLRPEVSFDQVKHRADTTRWLAIAFITLFATTFVGHYTASAFLHSFGMTATAEFLSSIFDKWLSGITALTGSVVTYYFTKEK